MMRIISGTHKGRRIAAPKNLPTRPTTDRTKEALFNILGHQWDFEGLHVLDLFAGTGNISYEFCSRGVAQVVAVDQHHLCCKFIKQTSAAFGFPIEIVSSEVLKYLQRCSQKYDLIFADPPYDFSLENYQDLLDTVFNHDVLHPGGQLILEHDPQWKWEKHPNWIESRVYGSNQMSFFEKKAGR